MLAYRCNINVVYTGSETTKHCKYVNFFEIFENLVHAIKGAI